MVFGEHTESHGDLPTRLIAPKEIYFAAKKDPQGFWDTQLGAIQRGFSRPQFVAKNDNATVGIVIPAHNETLGDKNGNLQACLYAISQLKIPPDMKVKTVIITHNCSPEDKASRLATQVNKNIEVVSYDTSLRGFSYPLQVGALLWREGEISEVGIIDADTVVNQDWLTVMHVALQRGGAVAAPRTYLQKDGSVVRYGEIKVFLEKSLQKLHSQFPRIPYVVKLVSGNSYFKAELLAQSIRSHLGEMITDGVIQRELEAQGHQIVLESRGLAVSDGEKFAHLSPSELTRTLKEKIRLIYLKKAGIEDNIRFLLFELAHYFPDFQARVEKYRLKYEVARKSGDTKAMEAIQASLYREYDQFNSENYDIMKQDLENLRTVRNGG